ncbi:MAG: hypothetical protein H6696_00735 [Deferribacteres bacterium]|nr:hypothetical protein [candidate division KSB1 bacterium]MCB9500432.1 hypothetical protein [Deferribacteres bacterium]
MEEIYYNEFIITCEACGNVKRFTVEESDDTESLFQNYQCENGCGRNMLSFIKLGLLQIGENDVSETV